MPPIATGSMPLMLHPGRTDLACCCLSEGRQWVQEWIRGSILPPVLPHPTKSIQGHPGTSFHQIPLESTRRRRNFRRQGATGPLHGFECMSFPFACIPVKGSGPTLPATAVNARGGTRYPSPPVRCCQGCIQARTALACRCLSGGRQRGWSGSKVRSFPGTTPPQKIDSGPSWGLVCVRSRINLRAGAAIAANRGLRDRCMD